MRSDINLPVMGVTILLAALLQDMISLSPWMPVKIPFLSAVALFYIITRPFPKALLALVWAGMLTDALGGLPAFCTIGFLLCVCAARQAVHSLVDSANLLTGMVLCAALGCVQMLWTRLWSGAAGIGSSFALLGYSVLAGAIAGGVGFAICQVTDNLSGCVKTAKEKNGLSWSKAD